MASVTNRLIPPPLSATFFTPQMVSNDATSVQSVPPFDATVQDAALAPGGPVRRDIERWMLAHASA